MTPLPFPAGTTDGGALLVLAILVPILGIVLLWAAGPRQTERVALGTLAVSAAIATAVLVQLA